MVPRNWKANNSPWLLALAYFVGIAFVVAWALALTSCIPTPTPEPTPIPPTATPTPVPVDAWLFTCKVDKCPVLRARGTNDSGAPIISINTGTYFVDGDVIQFYYPCVVCDGSYVYCEIYRDASGDVWQRGNYINRSKLARVY